MAFACRELAKTEQETAMEPSERSMDMPYRDGYREGFQDGLRQGTKSGADANNAKKPPDRGGNQEGKESDKKDDGKEGEGKPDQDDKGAKKPPLYKRPLIVAIALAVLLVLIIAGIIFWRHSRKHETTDDAFIDGYTSQIAAQTGGRVVKLYVIDNQLVHVGDPLLDIDSRDNDARVLQARGQLAGAKSQLEQAEAQIAVSQANADQAEAAARQSEADWRKTLDDLHRYRTVDRDAVAGQQVDAAVTGESSARERLEAVRKSARASHAQVNAAMALRDAAQSQIQTAEANVTAADLQSSYTHVVAPISGRISRRAVDVGNVIALGQSLLALVSEELWVTANYKETQLTYMRRGQPVDIEVDAFPGIKFRGQIDSIQKSTGAYFSSLPAENATGNYVKVVQRVPVKITFVGNDYQKYDIGPGMSVEPDATVR
jgi:membrane fusion protein (multidrug efflux system)